MENYCSSNLESTRNQGFMRVNAVIHSQCVVAKIGTHRFSLVRSMGTQNSRGVVLLSILAKRLEILAVHTVFKPGLVNKDNHVGVFVPITIITAHDYFFNYFGKSAYMCSLCSPPKTETTSRIFVKNSLRVSVPRCSSLNTYPSLINKMRLQ